MGDIHSPKSTADESGNEITVQRNINGPWSPPDNQEDWTVFDHFPAAVRAQEPDRDQNPPLFNPGWLWKQYVDEQYAKTQPPRSVDLEAIRNTWPQPIERKPSSYYTSDTDICRDDHHEVMVWPMDGPELEEWKKEYFADDPEEAEVDAEDDEIEFVRERTVIDLTQDDDDEVVPVHRAQDNGLAAATAGPGRQTLRQMIMADMKKRTRGL